MDSPRIAPDRPTGGLLIPLLLVAAIVLTLWPVCTAQFTQWDDIGAIATERTFLPPTWHSVAVWWTRPILFMWIPLSYSTWGLLALIAKEPATGGWTLNPFPFHCFNLLLHVLSAIIVWRMLVLLVKRPWPAAAGAALWALHPVQVEAVAWATGLRDVLCGFFTFVALWQYVGAVLAEELSLPRAMHYLFATAAYVLAMLAKPSAVVTPLVAVALEAGIIASWRAIRSRWRLERTFHRILFWLFFAIPIALIARGVQPVYRVSEYVPMWHRPLVALDAIAFYVGKIAFPVRLCIDYGRSPIKIFDAGPAYWTWLIPAAIAAFLAVFARRRPMVLAGAAVFVLGLLPVLGLAPFAFQSYSTVADHYLYVSMFGVALMAAAWLASPAVMRHGRIVAGGALVVLGLLAFDSFSQTWAWQNTDTLFRHSLQIDPHGPAVNDWLAREWLDAGQGKRAETYAEASIRGNPKRSHPYVLLAEAYRQQGDKPAALAAARKAYALEPADPDVVMGLAVVLDDDGRNAESTAMFQQAIALDPSLPETHLNFAIHLANIGQKSEALAELQKAAALAPDDPALLVHVGDELADMGRSADARSAYESALHAQAGFGPALDGLLKLPSKEGSP